MLTSIILFLRIIILQGCNITSTSISDSRYYDIVLIAKKRGEAGCLCLVAKCITNVAGFASLCRDRSFTQSCFVANEGSKTQRMKRNEGSNEGFENAFYANLAGSWKHVLEVVLI